MKRRTRQHLPFFQSSRGFTVILGVIAVAGLAGYIHFQSIVDRLSRRYADQYVHPYDVFADLCLTATLCAAAVIYLSRRDAPLRTFHKLDATQDWRDARGSRPETTSLPRQAKHQRPNRAKGHTTAQGRNIASGYNGEDDN